MKRYIRIFLIGLPILIAGCSRNKIYDRIKDLPDRSWPKNQSVDFQFNITDTRPGYDLYYNIRNSILYKYYNLYLSCTLEDTLGNVLETKLSDFNLFDPKTGKPLGDGLGDLFDHQFVFLDNYHFNNPGIYRLHVNQYMREDILMEIMSVGLVIRKNNEPGK
jgi:gliding motility-associated lipoprotein GldH